MKAFTHLLCLLLVFVSVPASAELTVSAAPIERKITPDDKIYISMPIDGKYQSKIYAGSGLKVGNAIQKALLKNTRNGQMGIRHPDLQAAIAAGGKKNASVVVFTQITHWEDRATEWSGMVDKIELMVTVVDPVTEQVIDQGIIKDSGNWFVSSLSDQRPEDLIEKPLTTFFNRLF